METFVTLIFTLLLFGLIAFITVINAITKILGGGTGKIAATGFIGFLLIKAFGPKLEKSIEEYRNHINQNK